MGIIPILFGHIWKNNMKTIVVTGATSGIGLEVARELLKQGHRVISGTRNMYNAENVRAALIKDTKNTYFDFYQVDFANFESVKQFAKNIEANYDRLDILINNAGTWEIVFQETVNGIETNLQVNHLSPMLLTLWLIPMLSKSRNSRIVNTSSGAHRRDILNLEDPEFRKTPYDGVASYSQSKLLNILFSLELTNRLQNTGITVNTVHPGYVKSSLFDKMGVRNWEGVPTADKGAQSALYAALSKDMEGVSGRYLYLNQEDYNLSLMAQDKFLALESWNLSMQYLRNFLPEIVV
jgi:NAD(P)-dependent dehydrogenase (short-subunit alcohol dehydrogenase family)